MRRFTSKKFLLGLVAVLAVVAIAVAVGFALRGEETVDVGGMEISRADYDDAVNDSMKVDTLDDLEQRTPKDRARLTSSTTGTRRSFELTASPFRWEYRDGQSVAVWGYERQIPGPVMTVTAGDTVRVRVNNKLPEATTVHWHGVDLPFDQDGVPGITQRAIPAGDSYTYEFPAQPAGTRFYHTHGGSPGDEARQLDLGLSGALVIKPRVEQRASVDVPLVLDEWNVAEGGFNAAMLSGGGHAAHNAGYNVFTINGRAAPDAKTIKVEKGDPVRLRFINAGTSTTHPMHLHGHQFSVTATDGNAVPTTAQTRRNVITVAPGETYDVEFTADNPGVWMLHCHELHHADAGMMTLLQYDGFEPVDDEHASSSEEDH